jgi:tetratricopeptide (TPR) repeat protein
MSPEQAALSNVDVDTRSDVYSLGVILYELLTATLPFAKERFQEAGYEEMRRIIREEEPPKPSTRISTLGQAASTVSANRQSDPRRLSQLYRGELDWIVMKALEKDRNRRYESASAFAADVRRYLADEPVRACPPSAWYRSRKFARRHKAGMLAAAAVGLAVLLGMVFLVLSNVAISREKQQKETALGQREAALTQLRQEKERADQNLARAKEAVKQYLTKTADNRRLKAADLHDLRKDLLATAIPFYEEFVRQKSDDPELEAERGEAYGQLAMVREALGDRDQALAGYQQALEIFTRLAAAPAANPRYRRDLAATHGALGLFWRESGKPLEAEAAHRQALKVLEGLAGSPTDPQSRIDLAKTHLNLGVLLREMGRLPEAQESLDRGQELCQNLVDESEDAHGLSLLTPIHILRGNLLRDQDKPNEAVTAFRQAAEAAEKAAQRSPALPEHRHALALAHHNLGSLLSDLGKLEDAEGDLRRALAIRQKLADDFTTVPEYRFDLATTQNSFGIVLMRRHKPEDAVNAFRSAVDQYQKLYALSPTVPDYCRELARAHNSLGAVLWELRQTDEAERSMVRAVELKQRLAEQYPNMPDYQSEFGAALRNLAFLRGDQLGRPEKARQLLEQAVSCHLAALKTNPLHPQYRFYLRGDYRDLAKTLLRLGNHAEVARVAEKLSGVFPENPAGWYEAGGFLAQCATLAQKAPALGDGERHELTRRYADQAMQMLRAALAKGFRDVEHLKQNQGLDPLRSRADFKELLAQLEAKASK